MKEINNEALEAMELCDEDLDVIAGGAYSWEEWKAMSVEERKAAQDRSAEARRKSEPCELD